MIALDQESAIASHLRGALGDGFPQSDEVIAAVELYCEFHCPDRLINGYFLELLLARALIKAGQLPHARRVLQHNAEAVDSCCAALSQEPCPHRMIKGLSAQLVRPTRWAAAGDHITWTLDLRRLANDPLVQMELGVLPAIRALLDEAAALWDDSDGAGGLAILGLDALTLDRRDVRAYCEDWLNATVRRRNWSVTPELLLLDG